MIKKESELVKVALVLPTLHSGGMERVMSELANYFASLREYEVHLVLFGKKPELFYKINDEVIIHINDLKFHENLRFLESLKRLKYLRKVIKELKPASVLSFGTQWNNFVLLALSGLKIPIFISDRGSPNRIYTQPQEFFKNFLYPKASGIIAQTSTAKTVLEKRFPNSNIRVIGNPIRDMHAVKTKHSNTLLSVGRLISTKHHDRLIDIFKNLDRPEWKLIIVGGDALKEKNMNILQQKIDALHLRDNIKLAGEQKNVEFYYKLADIFVFTSSVEGFPNVLGEALSSGLPVVSYDCIAGPADMITNGENGFLIPVFDDEQFSQKLLYLMENKELMEKMGEKAKLSISKFSIKNIGDNYLDFIIATKL